MIRIISILLISMMATIHYVSGQTLKSPLGKTINPADVEAFLNEKMKTTATPGLSLVIISDSKIGYHTVKGNSGPDKKVTKKTIFEAASLSKPLFGYFVMHFVEKGLIDLDKPLYQYLPYQDIAHDLRYKKITARIVLSHTTGFPNWRTDTPGNKLFLDFEPGSQFQYSGEGYQYLALVLQKILDTDAEGLQKYFHKIVAKPLGLKVTRYIRNNKNQKNKAQAFKDGKWLPVRDQGKNEFGAAYGINTEAKDWAKWVIALMNEKGLSTKGFAEYYKDQTELPEGNPNRQFGITHLSLGLYKGTLPSGAIYGHGGNNDGMFTSMFFFDPTTKWGAILFTNGGFGEQIGVEFFQYMMQYGL